MPTNNIIIEKELDSFSAKGSTDAKLNQDIIIDSERIKPAAVNIYYNIKAKFAGNIEKAKMQLSQSEEKIKNLKLSLESLKKHLNDLEVMSVMKLIFFYTLPGLIYVIGDIMFSMELIVKGWGLGMQNAFERYSLAIAIGLAPFFVKHIIDRFFEPNLENGSPQLKRLLTATYIGFGVIMIFAFCQIAYVRNIFFRFMKTDLNAETNVYNILFENHGSAVAWSFILVALMFVIGGGFLLSISSREFAKRKKFNQLTKSKRNNKQALNQELDRIANLKSETATAETLLLDWENKEERIEYIENELKYAYKDGFQIEIKKPNNNHNSNEIDDHDEAKDTFHHFVRKFVDQYSTTNPGSKYNA